MQNLDSIKPLIPWLLHNCNTQMFIPKDIIFMFTKPKLHLLIELLSSADNLTLATIVNSELPIAKPKSQSLVRSLVFNSQTHDNKVQKSLR